jgi:hypothetical protein
MGVRKILGEEILYSSVVIYVETETEERTDLPVPLGNR